MNYFRVLFNNKLEKRDKWDYFITHGNCTDGNGARYSIEKYFKTTDPEKKLIFRKGIHGTAPPMDIVGKNVLLCDFSYKRCEMEWLISRANDVLVLDHHITNEKELENIDNEYKVFTQQHSGAYITWQYFNLPLDITKSCSVPLLLEYIQDRDLWTNKLHEIEYFASWFHTIEYDYDKYDKYASDDDLLVEKIHTKGKAYHKLNQIYINTAASYAIPIFIEIDNKYYFVPHVNCSVPELKSSIGNKIFEYVPLADFSVVYSIASFSRTNFSLRSGKKYVNVGEIAYKLNGGGHNYASGCKTNTVTDRIPSRLLDSSDNTYNSLYNIYFDKIKIGKQIFNIVLLNSSNFKHELSVYLLQDKYYKDDQPVCEAISIYNEITGKADIETVHISFVWDYVYGQINYCYNLSNKLCENDRTMINENIQDIYNKIMTPNNNYQQILMNINE